MRGTGLGRSAVEKTQKRKLQNFNKKENKKMRKQIDDDELFWGILTQVSTPVNDAKREAGFWGFIWGFVLGFAVALTICYMLTQ
jgi:hypothetical protein